MKITVLAKILKSEYAMIIGRKTINENLISLKCFKYFTGVTSVQSLLNHIRIPEFGVRTYTNVVNTTADRPRLTAVIAGEMRRGQIFQKDELLTPAPDEEYVDPIEMEAAPWEHNLPTEHAGEQRPQVFGSIGLKASINALVDEFPDIFRQDLNPEPARLPPMKFEVDETKWCTNANRQRIRNSSITNHNEIQTQVNKMQAAKVITLDPNARYYSQVLLTQKPDKSWRFCIDFRRLNLCLKDMLWPIPNIDHMIRRLGKERSTVFATFDMTKGYWQLLIDESCQRYTAFITILGIFVWLRVPMGIKPAAAYFQCMMMTIVLVKLIYVICEVYIDDIIVHGKTETEFIDRLRQVFMRLREYKINLNPVKSKIGMDKVVYVGSLIDKDGMHYTKEKLSEVEKFPIPKGIKTLRAFLGLANYFSKHIKDFVSLAKAMREVVTVHGKTKKFVWTEEATLSFEALRQAIVDCPKLYFISTDVKDRIYLNTDASDYGYGAYLHQIVGSEEHPICFMSKTFKGAQLRWNTVDKECFAIFMALQQFHYLLHAVHFTLRTDSRNLIFINTAEDGRVFRWKIQIQKYNFQIEHIPGKLNIVADGFSRLVSNGEEAEAAGIDIVCSNYEFDLPKDKFDLVKWYHNGTVGHHGVERTIARLERDGHKWEKRREHVRRFVKSCPCCQKMSYLQIPIHTHPFTTVAYRPMERLNMDYVGPFPEDEYKNTYILVIIDTFTRATGLYPVPAADGKYSAMSLLHFIGYFGCPTQIVSDRGSHFVNEIIKEFMILMGTEHKLTLAYSKEENAMVENANKRVQEYLRDIMFERRIIKRWSAALPLVQRILMTDKNEVTNATPAELLFGNAVDLDRGIFLPHVPVDADGREVRLSEWAASMLQVQKDLIDIAQQRQRKRDARHLSEHMHDNVTQFDNGTFVLASYPNTGMGRKPPTKLHPRLRGPYQVVNRLKDTYTVRNLLTDSLEDFHATTLHPYHRNDDFLSPQEVMLRDKDEFHIETVFEHRGDDKRLSSLEFKVKWLGFDESFDTWEPWKNLRATTQLHDYLIRQGLQNKIPKEFRSHYPADLFGRRARRIDVPLIPIQNFAQEQAPPRRGPRQVLNALKRRRKVRFHEKVSIIRDDVNENETS
jgi:hypothetical protein